MMVSKILNLSSAVIFTLHLETEMRLYSRQVPCSGAQTVALTNTTFGDSKIIHRIV